MATSIKELRRLRDLNEDKMKRKALIPPLLPTVVVVVAAAAAAASAQYEEQLSIHTLAPRDRLGGGIHVADALLSDWEGDHWVSLDADLDKVSLSWTTDAEHVTFQVGKEGRKFRTRGVRHSLGFKSRLVRIGHYVFFS